MRKRKNASAVLQLKPAVFLTVFKVALIGVIAAQVFLISAGAVRVFIVKTDDMIWLRSVFAALYGIAAVGLPAIALLSFQTSISKILISRRVDLLLAFAVGCLVGLGFATAAQKCEALLSRFSVGQLTICFAAVLVLLGVAIADAVFATYSRRPERSAPLFISDEEKYAVAEDLLGVRDNAERFAARVLNGGAEDSMVFGLDAPWGSGKSTFINLCAEFWRDNYDGKVIVYRFNPLQYEDRSHLLGKFVDGLISTIKAAVFLPELTTVMSRYAELIKAEKKISFWGIEWSVGGSAVTVEQASEQLKEVLSTLSHRVIVIVDDLDRMEFSAIKDVLFAIKKAFSLPNVSFILCYDTQNIAALERTSLGVEKVSEFLEKFVNLKTSLFLSSAVLKRFITETRSLASARNPLSDVRLLDDVLAGLIAIYDSQEYSSYLPLVGDPRKIKRLLNILVLLNIGQTDFKNSDYDTGDLIHLLLVYINYPGLFRQIYNAETDGRFGFFSLRREYESGGDSKYVNSGEYARLIEGLKASGRLNEVLLLERLFNVERLKSESFTAVSEEAKHSLACFNNPDLGQANLSAYLELIVSASPKRPETSYRRFLNLKDGILRGDPVEKVFELSFFAPEKGEESYEEFWRVISNSLEEFNAAQGSKLIRFLLQDIPRHSALELRAPVLGFRFSSQIYFLLKLVDTVGWADEVGRHRNNTDVNLIGITDWIYGEGNHRNEGILDTLMSPQRGTLGLHDMLMFRLYCCIDRGSTLFNLSRAVGLHSDRATPREGLLTNIVKPQMRELSQAVFLRFKSQYIEPTRNVFDDFNALLLGDLVGDFMPAIDIARADGLVSFHEIENAIAITKVNLRNFCVYQLANKLVQSGIGCGYYDESGTADRGGIASAMNDYLLGFCFSGAAPQGFKRFVDFLLTNLTSAFSLTGKRNYVPRLESFCTIFDREKLKNYWAANSGAIKAEFIGREGVVPTSGYTASYAEDLEPLFAELDKLLVSEVAVPTNGDLLPN